MGFYLQDDMWEAVEELPKSAQDAYFGALARLYFAGDDTKPSGKAKGYYTLARDRVKMARKKADSKKTERRKTSDKNGDTLGDIACDPLYIREGEGEDKTNVLSNPPNPPSDISGDIPFWVACLSVLNETIGACYSTMPTKCRHMLERMQGTYTPEDVRQMIVYKRDEWKETDRKQKTTLSKNLTPNTLFSPDHFEQYMHQSQSPKETNDYAKYDR